MNVRRSPFAVRRSAFTVRWRRLRSFSSIPTGARFLFAEPSAHHPPFQRGRVSRPHLCETCASRESSTSSYAPAHWIWKTAEREIASAWIEAYKQSAGSTPLLVRIQPCSNLCHSRLSAVRADLQTSIEENNLLPLCATTSHNRCAKFGFLTQLDTNLTDSGQMNLLLVRTLRTCRWPR